MSQRLPAFPLDHLAMRGKAGDAALNIKGQIYSYEQLNSRISRLAAILRGKELAPGERVASWIGKGEIACLMPLAAARAELIYVPINPLLKPAQVAHILNDSAARLLITNAARAGQLQRENQIPFVSSEAETGEGSTDQDLSNPERIERLETNSVLLVNEKALVADIDTAKDELAPLPDGFDTDTLAAILYTSGSTGRPKGVMLSHANLSLGALSVAEYLKLADDDVTLAVLPLSFDYGQNQLFSTWAAGGCAVPLDYLMARDCVKACAKYSVTTLAAVPPLWVQLTEQEWSEEATRSMRRLTNSGGALTPSLVKELRSIFDDKTDIYAMYGLTEAFRSTYLDPALIDDNPTSMGKAIPHAEIMVVAPDGTRADIGQEGELVHAGPLVAKGYWRDEERTAERFKPAPEFSEYAGSNSNIAVYSGDNVRREADGLLYFVGRDDAMIKTSGNRVSPTEVEEVAVESGFVAEACVLGKKDDRLGEAIVLFARAEAGIEDAKAQLNKYLKAALPNFMQPSQVIWIDEFPRNANGKLDRNSLKTRISS